MAYVFVTGDVKVAAQVTMDNSIKQIPPWMEFTTEEQRNRIYDNLIESFSDIIMFTENIYCRFIN